MSIEALVGYEDAESALTNAENLERSLRHASVVLPDDAPVWVQSQLMALCRFAREDIARKRRCTMETL